MITLKDILEKPYLRHILTYVVSKNIERKYNDFIYIMSDELLEAIKKLYETLDCYYKYEDVRFIYKYFIWNIEKNVYSYWPEEKLLDIVNNLKANIEKNAFNGCHEDKLPDIISNLEANIEINNTSLGKLDLLSIEYFDEHVEEESYTCFQTLAVWNTIFSILRQINNKKALIKILKEEILDPKEYLIIRFLNHKYNNSPHLENDKKNKYKIFDIDGTEINVTGGTFWNYQYWKPITTKEAFLIDLEDEKYYDGRNLFTNQPIDQLEGPNWHHIPKKLKNKFDSLVVTSKLIHHEKLNFEE